MPNNRPLTAKQTAFIDAYLVTRNAAESVRTAGYQSKRPDALGYQLLRVGRVQREIRARQTALVRRTEVDAEWVLHRLAQTYALATEAKQYTAANRSLELVGRTIGMFDQGPQVSPERGYEITVRKVSSDAVPSDAVAPES
jgi:phage terminase small subunit